MKFLISIIFYLLFTINSSFSFEQNPEQGDIGTGGREDSTFMNPKNSNIKKVRLFYGEYCCQWNRANRKICS